MIALPVNIPEMVCPGCGASATDLGFRAVNSELSLFLRANGANEWGAYPDLDELHLEGFEYQADPCHWSTSPEGVVTQGFCRKELQN